MNKLNGATGSHYADFLLIGGGLASATAAETLREADTKSSIVMLSAESVPPYHNPPLSKGFLTGDRDEAKLFVHPENFYREKNIELRLNTPALSVDPARQTVTFKGGEIGYGQLLIATGGFPRKLSVPGAELPGVFNLRFLRDAKAIREAASFAKRAAVVGGSYLGMEVAMSLLKLGLDVTLGDRGEAIFPYLGSASLSEYFKRYAEDRGLTVLLGESLAALEGRGKVEEAITVSGKRVPCDLVVAAIGISPATGFLAGSGIELEDGYVAVDALLRTSAPNVYAAGDVTAFFDPVFARRRHIEHWDNAVKQGRLVAYNMLGRRKPYDEISYFFCDLGSMGFSLLGAAEEGKEWIGRGSLDAHSYAMFYLRNNVVRALFSTGRPAAETRAAEDLIRYRTHIGAYKVGLSDPDFSLDSMPAQTALVLQGGGALGAFECGVVKALEEERIFPDAVAGVSIGALNGAIVAGNPRNATQALEAFWDELTVAAPQLPFFFAPIADEKAAIALNILTFGIAKFFRPRWLPPYNDFSRSPMEWTSFYDASPMKSLIAKYVDFAKLRSSPVRLLISAVNVTTAELEIFDSYVDDLTPDHVLASGSLPPGFPWTVVDGKPYWDGGIVSNSPLNILIERSGPDGKRIFVVDLFRGERALPTNMMEVLARRDEIVYADRVMAGMRHREIVNAYRGLVDEIAGHLKPEDAQRLKQRPSYIQLMGDGTPTSTIRLTRPAHQGEQPSRDYDFSDAAIKAHKREGYMITKQALRDTSQAAASK
jgi:NADPH-dependent 2,4-dienoyl-CoA reductase/sulfur reductase-like enzyme/predicted acylesterase/phospholipase RssA